MDRLETELKNTKHPQMIQNVFGGSFASEIICLDCPHRSIRKEDFLAVNLQIQNKTNLHESLQSFINSETLTGNNAYLCERCDKKVSAKKRTTLGVLPNVMVVVLKRFEFDIQLK